MSQVIDLSQFKRKGNGIVDAAVDATLQEAERKAVFLTQHEHCLVAIQTMTDTARGLREHLNQMMVVLAVLADELPSGIRISEKEIAAIIDSGKTLTVRRDTETNEIILETAVEPKEVATDGQDADS